MDQVMIEHINDLKTQISGLENKFTRGAKLNANFYELKEILFEIKEIKKQISSLEEKYR